MYLSRVIIDKDNRKKIRDLTDLSAYHAWVEESFPMEIRDHVRSRKLWRIDKLNGKEYLLVVSETKPDYQFMEKYGIVGSAESRNYDPFLNSLKNGMRCRFRAVLNPVVSVSQQNARRGRVMPEITVSYQRKYFLERTDKNGFSVLPDDFMITERGYENWHKGKDHIRLCKAAYEGTLTVTDADLLRKALTHGIGRKKAYGFGMMTVIPLSEQ